MMSAQFMILTARTRQMSHLGQIFNEIEFVTLCIVTALIALLARGWFFHF